MLALSYSTSYLNQIHKLPFLTRDEEYMLAKRWVEHKDLEAAHQLVVSHLRYVVKIASCYKTYGLPFMDLVQEGTIGLMQAVKKFDPEKGFRLATYAMMWIKSYIQDYILRSWSLVKIGTTAAQKKLFYNLRRIRTSIGKIESSRLEPKDVKLIAQELNVEEDEVINMDSRLMQNDKSLNDPILVDGDNTEELIDTIASSELNFELVLGEKQEKSYRKELFAEAFKTLNEREQELLKLRHLTETPMSHIDLGKHFNISYQRVQQIEARIFEKLKQYIQDKKVNDS